MNMECIEVDSFFLIDPELLQQIPEHFTRSNILLPLLEFSEDGLVRIAVATPFLGTALSELSVLLNMPVKPVLTEADRLMEKIDRVYATGIAIDGFLSETDEEEWDDIENIEDLKDMAKAAPVIKLVNTIFIDAIKQKASDIHISPYENGLEIRYRIDGVLKVVSAPPKKFQAAIISRVKIMADLDIAERRVPQDGRIRFKVEGKDYDIRVATTPNVFAEGVVMRILDKSSVQIAIEDVGFEKQMLTQWKRQIELPSGVVLVTGPTGSGKTSTLYASLNHIKSPEVKIITTEDPVEYQINGIDQIQVNTKVGLTFAKALRSILRQDPDVVMVGEIRDEETAEICTQASLTGHLVMSTLHTNDAPTAITRLIEMGIEPYLVASTLVGSLAQRLVREICPYCKVQNEEGRWVAKGCDACQDSGYKGRLGIYELLIIDDVIRELIMKKEGSSVIFAEARKRGMKTLWQDGMEKVAKGLTTEAEIRRVAGED